MLNVKLSMGVLRSRLIILAPAFLLFHSPQVFEPASSSYQAQPKDVAPWAEQGNFRFVRVDGGEIESRKAERTWWGRDFSAQEKDALDHIYDRDFERMLGFLKQAQFNWIWVTWSNGWSVRHEAENRENLKRVIARCHQSGIHVTAYLSASNMFPEEVYRDEPETRNYGLWMHGLPMFYAGPSIFHLRVSWHRRLADARKPGWRAYLLRKAEMAIDAGADAIVWDNMIGYNGGLAQLLDDTQQLAQQKALETGRPKVMVSANVHISPVRFGMNDINEVIWEEDGKDSPGVWRGKWNVTNARNIKFLNAEKQSWQPLMYENDLYHCGPRERCIPSPAVQKLSIAEAYAFGAATSRNIEGRFLSALMSGEPDATESWAAIAQYNCFLDRHRDLYHDVAPVSQIALISAEPRNPIADNFLRQSVIFETKVLSHLDKGVPLNRFKILVMPSDLPRLDAEQEMRFNAFTAAGGIIIRAKENDRTLVERVNTAAGGPRLTLLEPHNRVLGQLTMKPDGRTIILHLLNYDQTAANGVHVRMDLGGLATNLSAWKVKALSPDASEPQLSGISLRGSIAEFTLQRIEHYTVVTLAAEPQR